MAKVYLRPSFQKDLLGLRANHRVNYNKLCALLVELETGVPTVVDRRAETRIEHCVKYELQDGYRVVFQKVEGSEALVALCVGKHDHVDGFLDSHKGWVFDPATGRMKEMRLAAVDEATVNVVASNTLAPRIPTEESMKRVISSEARMAVFRLFDDAMLRGIGVPPALVEGLLNVDDPNSTQLMLLLQQVANDNQGAADLLVSYATGDRETQDAVLAVARGERTYNPQLAHADEAALKATTDEFISFDDPKEMEEVLDTGKFEQWQLFLHPDQTQLVCRRFDGPARIRGISGSGKTVVALHRARRQAKALLGTNRRILFTTFNRALAKYAG